jgi:single-stranded-DNA-specific exonuclease
MPAPRSKLLELSASLGISPAMAAVLASRGLDPIALEHPLELTPNPALQGAARRIIAAIKAKKRIRIHGDYDADGITASSLLMLGLRDLGAQVHAFIPRRLYEGYGIHPDKVAEHIESCDLMITVDCGVSNLEEVEAITKGGTEVIITDHHSPGHEIPNCLVVHPALTPNYDHDVHNLTGAGVAYHLLWAVRLELGLDAPLEYADLAAIGIVADVAPLIGENRALVMAGLRAMQDSHNVGLRALLRELQLTRAPTATDIAFLIAPRINAAGRLGEADTVLEFLTTQSEHQAQSLALYMDMRNKDRRVIQDQMLLEALEIVDPSDPAIVITKEGWHAGIMGIVAAKLLETYYKPVFIIAQGKGSVRSTPGISAVEGLRQCAHLLKRYGGHTGAAGFSIYDQNIPALQNALHDYARGFPTPVPTVQLDAPLPQGAITRSFLEEISQLEPYGQGIRAPLWWVSGLLNMGAQMGKTKQHYQFDLGGMRGKKWSFHGPSSGQAVQAAVRLGLNEYKGKVSLEFEAENLAAAVRVELEGRDVQHLPSPNPPNQPNLTRLEPKAALALLESGAEGGEWAAYAEGEGRTFLEKRFPKVVLLSPDQEPNQNVQKIILMALPPAASLNLWLERYEVAFSWGEKTLLELESAYHHTLEGLKTRRHDPMFETILHEIGVESSFQLHGPDLWKSQTLRLEACDAFLKHQWAQLYRHLGNEDFSRAARVLAGG